MSDRIELKADLSFDEAGTITGIAWPFGIPDSVGDVIVKGAMRLPSALPILNEHDQRQVVGTWESVTETDTGIEVKGRLFIEGVAPARAIREQIRKGVSGGLSIGFSHNGFERLPSGGRKFTDITLTEISICRRPIHRAAGITEVKSEPQDSKDTHMENDVQNETETKALNDNLAALAAEVAKGKKRIEALEAKGNRVPVGEAANDDTETKAFEVLLRHGEKRLADTETKALVVANDGAGGYLAPSEYGAEIIKKLVEWSPIRQYARIVTIGAREIKYPRKVSGATALWTEEGADSAESTMVFEQVTIAPHQLTTFTDISTQLLEDTAYDLRGELIADYAEAFGKAEAVAFVSGNGTGKPKGLLAATGIAEVKTGAAATLGTDPAATIIGMFHSLPGVHAQNAVWLMNRKTLAALRTLKDATGRFIMLDPITSGGATTLLGRPIVEAVDMPDVAAGAFPIMFGDLQGYRIVNRTDLNVLPDPYTNAAKSQVRFHARARVGADLTHPDRFVKLKVAA